MIIIQNITSLACYFGISRAVLEFYVKVGWVEKGFLSHIIGKEDVIEEVDSRLKINSNMPFQMYSFVSKPAMFIL